jgi:hypothetical protein
VFAGITKGEKIVASDPFPQIIKKFEVHKVIRELKEGLASGQIHKIVGDCTKLSGN